MNHFDKFCISPFCTTITGSVEKFRQPATIQSKTHHCVSRWGLCLMRVGDWVAPDQKGKRGLFFLLTLLPLPPPSRPPWPLPGLNIGRPSRGTECCIGNIMLQCAFIFSSPDVSEFSFLRRYCYTPVWALKNGRSGNVGPWVLNSLKEDKAKLEIQKEGGKREQDDKKKFFGFAIILDDRVSNLIYEGNISFIWPARSGALHCQIDPVDVMRNLQILPKKKMHQSLR